MKTKVALIYALLAFLTGALTQLLQALIAIAANQSSPLDSPTRWAISVAAGVVAAGVAAALPWLQAALPVVPGKPPA